MMLCEKYLLFKTKIELFIFILSKSVDLNKYISSINYKYAKSYLSMILFYLIYHFIVNDR